ncbi:hypothetical protein H7U37_01655 [Pseudoflavonifractor phocaeensis]|uniref:hypothetical protein n=1 Tax=Pseudoflavonifractor phocaeensis TaxID=1870988 RepID=UPI00195EE8D5|nr:hypothetical protein [Pseudoflavonifractor phocaeensis]MBM6937232.1 hypothetical protein [Pseudoflavonifractor phocaeensis]
MACIPCPECGHSVCRFAASCPGCGMPMASSYDVILLGVAEEKELAFIRYQNWAGVSADTARDDLLFRLPLLIAQKCSYEDVKGIQEALGGFVLKLVPAGTGEDAVKKEGFSRKKLFLPCFLACLTALLVWSIVMAFLS